LNLRRGSRSYRGLCHLRSPISGRRGRYPDRPTVWPRLEVQPQLVLRSSLRKRWNLWKNVGHPSRGLLPIAPSGGSRKPSRRPRLGILPCRFWLVKCITLAMAFQGIPKRSSLSSSISIILCHSVFNILIDYTHTSCKGNIYQCFFSTISTI